MRSIISILVALSSAMATDALAQTVQDPRVAEFQPSAEHSVTDSSGSPLVTSYSIAFYTAGGSLPVRTVNIGKPNPASDGWIRVNLASLLSSPLNLGVAYEARVSATGPGGSSSSSLSNRFEFTTATVAPSLSIGPSTINIGVAAGNGSLATTAQRLIVTQNGGTPAGWTVSSNRSWLRLSPSSGSGTGAVMASLAPGASVPTSNSTATVTLSSNSISGGTRTAQVTLTILYGTSAPFGGIDTPLNNSNGITGSIAVTGWALDDVGVSRVRIMRDSVAGEQPGVLVNLGEAVFVEGSRPDVGQAYPTRPNHTRAGWGYLLLTNMLPNQGNGTFTLHAFADDIDGRSTHLGSRTITATNSTSTRPFGAIDTPAQGETISGSSYLNYGWVLSRGARRADPPGGGAVSVVIDGVIVGTPGGWTNRSDISGRFPVSQYSGVNTAVAVYPFDTTALSNGVHTIAWVVTDDNGAAAGIGSRYFTVLNSGAMAMEQAATSAEAMVIAAPDTAAEATPALARVAAAAAAGYDRVTARRGFSDNAPFRELRAAASGALTMQAEELDRIEMRLSETSGQTCAGYMASSGVDSPLPVGSKLDPATCVFTWQPGVGFVGTYDFVFLKQGRTSGDARRINVRIVLNPKGSGRVGPQVVIDAPVTKSEVGSRFVVAGWAADIDAAAGTGIDTVHVWAYPVTGEQPFFLGAARYGGSRPDVAAVFGDQFRTSGYGLEVKDMAPGMYDVAVFGWSTVRGGWVPAAVTRVVVEPRR